ncbi:ABC transporter ATP-binding protein [Aerococcus tenax]|uniref:ABC transporter ATP-binding protein n=1 Tax=Aerococcus tenax TaxID=3078812 RepID=UPI000DCDD639|nr:ATP-binding cassette domain-containing protein [Aerococcus tenax]MDL5178591.1 ATP-binding cassette domain-containing protein [Aerococcus tenax]
MFEKVLEIKNLYKSYGKRKIINDLNMTVFKGDVYGFLGANGEGKTTTIRMITSLIRSDSGEILINEKSVIKNRNQAIKNIGAMVESPKFYENLSGYENLKLMAKLIDGTSDKDIDKLLELVGLKDRSKDKFASYSMGMKQRLGIANALLGNPDLIILDEPTNGLDPYGMRDINELIVSLAKTSNKTFIISSHLLHEMEGICNRVGILHDGKLSIEGDVEKLVSENNVSNLEELFFDKVGGKNEIINY